MMESVTCTTSEKILAAAIELFEEKGFKTVTMKEIAQAAGVSEMTVFRHFGSKRAVLEAAIRKFSYIRPMKKLFEERIVWDLEKDLISIAKTYHECMKRNRAVFFIAMRERNAFPWIENLASDNPRQLRELLTEYFAKMQAKGKMAQCNAEVQALAFTTMNLGYFINSCNSSMKTLPEDEFILHSVRTFARGLERRS